MPEEISAWIDDLEHAWSEFAPHRSIYPRQYREIAEQDSALLPRIDLLKAEDIANEEQCEKISQTIARMAQHHLQALID